jgi:MFS family permease
LGWTIWLPCIGQALCSFLSFLHRTTLAVLLPTILKETGLTGAQYGQVVSFFFLAYTLANPLWGSILDYVGLRVGMLIAVALWSGASASHAVMGSFFGFAVARALLGLGEGATFPGGLRTAVESLPTTLRGRGIATSFSGGTLGAIFTPIIVVPWAGVWLADRVPGCQRVRPPVAGVLVGRGSPALPPRDRFASQAAAGLAESARTPILGLDLQLRAASDFFGADSEYLSAVLQSRARRLAKFADVGVCHLDAATFLGHRVLLLGLGG